MMMHNLHFEAFENRCDSVKLSSNSRDLTEGEGGSDELSFLLSKEREIEVGFSIMEARVEAVEWMLNVTAFYSFSALTALLAVSYFDRFIHKFQSHDEKPWIIQLTAVASISLAAKLEETRVPLLLDLQVEESRYLFQSKTIQRMEILILSTLEWKLNHVTALSFIDYIARSRLQLDGHFYTEFIRRCERLILSVLSDCRFTSYLPSTLATATMLYVINSLQPTMGVECHDEVAGMLGAKKEEVVECCKMIEEVGSISKKRKFGSIPGSPKGVVEVSFSSTSCDSCSIASSPEPQSEPEPEPEPVSKRIKPPPSPPHGIF